jgi:hypothetical protein
MNTGWKTHQPNHQPEPHVHHVHHDHHGNRRQQERPGQQQQQAQRFSGPKRALEQSSGEDDQPGKEKGQQLEQGQGQQDQPEN